MLSHPASLPPARPTCSSRLGDRKLPDCPAPGSLNVWVLEGRTDDSASASSAGPASWICLPEGGASAFPPGSFPPRVGLKAEVLEACSGLVLVVQESLRAHQLVLQKA